MPASCLPRSKKARAEKLGYWGACPKAKLNTGLGSITGPG